MLSSLTKTLIALTTVATIAMFGFMYAGALHHGPDRELSEAAAITFLLVCVLGCCVFGSYMADNDPE